MNNSEFGTRNADFGMEDPLLRIPHSAFRISIIIVNWNGAQHLPVCLNALRAQTVSNFEVIVADNASHDESLQLLARDYAEVKVVALPENRGFTGGNNTGIRAARGEFVILLNNDTEVDPHWLEEISGIRFTPPEISIVSTGFRAIAGCGKSIEGSTTARSMSLAPAADRRRIA